MYPNIDIEFVLNDAANRGKFKYNFIVKPNGNLTDIKLAFLGANRTSLNQAGNILIETAYGNIEENIPLSYVITNNNSHSSIKANFIELDNNTYGINAENYNHNQTLVIDPTNWATLFGGIGYDVGSGIATDTSGNNIIIGNTQSINAIATVGAHQTILGGLYQDAFVAKFNNIGTLLWATYYGGIDADYGTGIATDISGNIIIGGYTYSSIGIATAGAYQTAISSGSFEAFITKFNTNGIRQWATYYGGNNQDQVFGITTDVFNNIIVTGLTNSTNAIATIGAYQTTYGGWNLDAFVAKFSDIGNLLWATYYGGNADDIGYGITSDVNGNIIVVGRTNSSNGIATVGSVKAFNFANYDGFVAKFNQSGGMLWATYLGGNFTDQANAVITDGNADIIVTGKSQTTNGGNYYAYITKFNTNGTSPWFNFYSGNVSSEGNGITIDASGNIIINGTTNSTTGIATIGAYQTTNAGYDISFFAKFNTNGIVQWGTYFGGGALNGNVITTDANGNIIITGATNSNSIVSIGAYQSINGGSSDAFIAKFSSNGVLPIKLISFNAALAYEKVNCAWETASETNNDYFTIERSKDGNDFEAVGN
ncbi:MAG: SBBP repeat-containing protein, partial [Bacteroidia bacterium]